MFITKTKHNKIIDELNKELTEAKSLKQVLTIIAEKTGIPTPKDGTLSMSIGGIGWNSISSQLNLPSDVAILVDDYYAKNSKVIKQEATKVVLLGSDGEIVGRVWTKRKPKDGYTYLLERIV